MFNHLDNRGEVDSALVNPMLLIIFITMSITMFTLYLQMNAFNEHYNKLTELADQVIRKPMEEEGGFRNSMWNEFTSILDEKGIDSSKFHLESATYYPVDRGEPVEVIIKSEYEIRALAYMGGPVMKRPILIKRIGVSQEFFR